MASMQTRCRNVPGSLQVTLICFCLFFADTLQGGAEENPSEIQTNERRLQQSQQSTRFQLRRGQDISFTANKVGAKWQRIEKKQRPPEAEWVKSMQHVEERVRKKVQHFLHESSGQGIICGVGVLLVLSYYVRLIRRMLKSHGWKPSGASRKFGMDLVLLYFYSGAVTHPFFFGTIFILSEWMLHIQCEYVVVGVQLVKAQMEKKPGEAEPERTDYELGDDFESNKTEARNVYQDLTRSHQDVILFFLTQLCISIVLAKHFIYDEGLHEGADSIKIDFWVIAVLLHISCSDKLSGDDHNFRMWNAVLPSKVSQGNFSFLRRLRKLMEHDKDTRCYLSWLVLPAILALPSIFGVLASVGLLHGSGWWIFAAVAVLGVFLWLVTRSFDEEILKRQISSKANVSEARSSTENPKELRSSTEEILTELLPSYHGNKAELLDEPAAAAERRSFKSLGACKSHGIVRLKTLSREWYARRWFDIIVNGMIRNQILFKFPIMLCMANAGDFVLSCTAVFFILTLDDTEPVPLTEVLVKLKFQQVLAEEAHTQKASSPLRLTYEEWLYANNDESSGKFARFETYYRRTWNRFRAKEEAKVDMEPARALAAKCWELDEEEASKLWKMHMT